MLVIGHRSRYIISVVLRICRFVHGSFGISERRTDPVPKQVVAHLVPIFVVDQNLFAGDSSQRFSVRCRDNLQSAGYFGTCLCAVAQKAEGTKSDHANDSRYPCVQSWNHTAFLLVRQLDLINSLWSLILPALTSGWYVLLMKGFFDSIPPSLEEAATIDGCNDINIWYRIILPLSLPAMAAFGLFYAVAYWNTFFTALLYINDFEKWPLQVLLQNLLIDSSTAAGGEVAQQISAERQVPSETLKMAAVVIGTVPILLVYPFLQKHFAKGAMVGSVKTKVRSAA